MNLKDFTSKMDKELKALQTEFKNIKNNFKQDAAALDLKKVQSITIKGMKLFIQKIAKALKKIKSEIANEQARASASQQQTSWSCVIS